MQRVMMILMALLMCGGYAANTLAQVKLEDALKKAAKPSLPPAPPKPAAAPLPCEKLPAGCTVTFKPTAESIAPQWYAKQEKIFTEANKSQQKANAYLAKYKAHAVKQGWELNDVARAYGFFVSLTYNVYSQGQGPDAAQLETMAARFRQELTKDAKFQANSDSDRQFIYERLILVALDNEGGYVYAKKIGDKVSQEKHRQRAKDWLEEVIEKPVEQIPNYWR